MPSTINGIGTKFYGCREKGPDGSYITTEWVVILYIPILPIQSLRVLPGATESRFGFPLSSSQRFMTRSVPLNWRQVLYVYLAVYLIPPAPIVIIIFMMWMTHGLR
jgi:hypothetical protein